MRAILEFIAGTTASLRGLRLVWSTHRGITVVISAFTLVAGALPVVSAYLGKLIVDTTLLAAREGDAAALRRALLFVGLEGLSLVLLHLCEHGLLASREILQTLMQYRINEMILSKARELELPHFEDARTYDRLLQARDGAATKPLRLIERTFGLIRDGISLLSLVGLLAGFSLWAVLFLVLASLPAFLVETSFANESFELFKNQSADRRMQSYLETVLSREDFVKEVKLFELADLFLQRYRDLFQTVFAKVRRLVTRRELWSFAFGLMSTGMLYGTYAWIVYATAKGRLSLGEMTMYFLVFKQGQSSFFATMEALGGMYEDNLYLTNLYEFLEQKIPKPTGWADGGPAADDGLRFEDVWFSYPGAEWPALKGVTFHLRPGQKLALVGENGSGKTTMVKLLTRLYEPQSGRILLEGRDIREWDVRALRRRIGVIFQDFIRYQFSAGENIGAGDGRAFDDESRWRDAAERGMADALIKKMPEGYRTRLGHWFKGGRELSGGEWQKMALSRAFMRRDADILILDEPTAAVDASGEAQIFDRLRSLTGGQMAIIISHRLSTVRLADQILVVIDGRIVEAGAHDVLMRSSGMYAHMFAIQSAGFR